MCKWVKFLKKTENQSEKEWKITRQDFNKFCRLCRFANDKISTLVLVSFFTNLYFITTSAFYALNGMRSFAAFLSFMTGFGLMCLRSACVCWFGGKVNEEIKEFLPQIVSLSGKVYNVEVR